MRPIKASSLRFTTLLSPQRYFRRQPSFVLGNLLVGASLVILGGHTNLTAQAPDPMTACLNLANLNKFPVTPTQITLAKWNPAGTTSANGVPLPDHCQLRGIINQRIGVDGYPYGDMFEVRLPTPSLWNGRFMFQGGGGTEGSVPAATGSAGTLSPTLARGWAVASQDGGHENSQLPFSLQFTLDPQAVADHAFRSIQVVTQTAKSPDYSYSVGCSTGGRQGTVFSQRFPRVFRRDCRWRSGL